MMPVWLTIKVKKTIKRKKDFFKKWKSCPNGIKSSTKCTNTNTKKKVFRTLLLKT